MSVCRNDLFPVRLLDARDQLIAEILFARQIAIVRLDASMGPRSIDRRNADIGASAVSLRTLR